jgi:hypothetical protein
MPAAIQLLQEVRDMYREELGVKRQVILGFWGEHAASWLSCSSGGQASVNLGFVGSIPEAVISAGRETLGNRSGGTEGLGSGAETELVQDLAAVAFSKGVKGKKGGSEDEEWRQCLTVAITTWMVMPYVDEPRVVSVLQLLTDDMTGF